MATPRNLRIGWAQTVSFTLILSLFAADLVSGTCYKLDGAPYSRIRPDDGDWVPCDNTARVSSCCSSKDYCMGNGMCLDAGANNYFSLQGCTDPSWPAPCVTNPKCESNIRDGYSFIFPCSQATNASFNYCCGQTADCCTDQANFISFEGVTQIARPTLLPADNPNPDGSSTTTTTTVTVTVTASAATGTQLPNTNPGNPTSNDSSATKTLGIGLGVGLGAAFLALAAALVFFGLQWRRKYRWDPKGVSMPIPNSNMGSPEPENKPPLFGGGASPPTVHDYYQQQQAQYAQQQQQQQHQGGLGVGGAGAPPPGTPPVFQGQGQFNSNSSTPVQAYNYSSQPPAPAVNMYQMQQQQQQQPPQRAQLHELNTEPDY